MEDVEVFRQQLYERPRADRSPEAEAERAADEMAAFTQVAGQVGAALRGGVA